MSFQEPLRVRNTHIAALGDLDGFEYELGVRQFCGIPYATLPKRWTRSRLCTSWPNHYHDGTKMGWVYRLPIRKRRSSDIFNYSNDCPRPGFDEGEDGLLTPVPPPSHFERRPIQDELSGLVMNIVAPSLPCEQLVPVMVYVHGGSLLYGGANLPIFDAVNLVSLAVSESKPIVCVNFNYRVGLGGFLASEAIQKELRTDGHEGCGNFGFTDQQVALQWVQRYITQFGGDPEQVTLVGESAGGISISNQLLAAQPSKFNRAVCMSGLATSIPAWTLEQHEILFREVCKHFEIDPKDPKVMDQLRLIDQAELAEATPAIQGVESGTGNPCLDGWFYAKDPGSIHAAPEWLESYMVGDVYHEGVIFSMNIRNETYTSVWKTLLEFIKDEAQLKTIMNAYDISPEQTQADFLAAVEHMAGDAVFKVPNYATALANKRLRGNGKLFLYHFDQRSQLQNELEGTAYHAYELLYLFGNLSDRMDDSERILEKQFAMAWINFVRGESPWEESSPKWKVWGPHGKMGLMEEGDDEFVRRYGRMSQILETDNGQTWKKWLLGVDALVNQRNNMWNRS